MSSKLYKLTPEITLSLFNESIEAIDFFLEKMITKENIQVLLNENKRYAYYFKKLEKWSNDLKKYKETELDKDDEVRQLVFTLWYCIHHEIGYSYMDKDGKIVTDHKISHLYHHDRPKNENFNKDLDEAYLKLHSTCHKLDELHEYLNEHKSYQKGIEKFNSRYNENLIFSLSYLKHRLEVSNVSEEALKSVIPYMPYEIGIELLHKIHQNEYDKKDLIDIINNRLEMLSISKSRG